MTVSTTPYYRWAGRNDSQQAPFNACSPNLVQILAYYKRRWGAVSLGCHVQRAVGGGSTLSSHAWGAACDPRFPDRQTTVDAMGWTIAYSVELGVNTIHDYQTQQMWKPGQGWVSASIGSVGGAWIHVETTPAAFGDGSRIEDRLPGTPDEIPGDDFMTPEDEKWLTKNVAPALADPAAFPDWPTFNTGEAIGDTRVFVQDASVRLERIEAQGAELKTVMDAVLAALKGQEFPVSGTVHIDTGE